VTEQGQATSDYETVILQRLTDVIQAAHGEKAVLAKSQQQAFNAWCAIRPLVAAEVEAARAEERERIATEIEGLRLRRSPSDYWDVADSYRDNALEQAACLARGASGG